MERIYSKRILQGCSFVEDLKFVCIDIPMYYYYRENSAVHIINQADVIDVIEKAYMKNMERYGDNKYLVLEQSFRTLLSARYLSSIDLAVDRCKRCNYLMDKLEIYRCSEIVWIKRLIYFLFRRFPWAFRLFRIISDPTMLKYEQDKKKNKGLLIHVISCICLIVDMGVYQRSVGSNILFLRII